MTPRSALSIAAIVAVTGASFAAVAGLPFFSESYNQLRVVASFTSPLDAFGSDLTPIRPLQHLAFHALASSGEPPAPALGRAFTYGLWTLAAIQVAAIARALGAGRVGTSVAVLSFLAFPAVKGLAWVCALSSPARLVCLLAVAQGTIAWSRGGGWRPKALVGVGLAAGLGFHPSAIVAPAIVALGVLWIDGERDERRFARLARDPAFVALLALALLYVVALSAADAERRHHGVVAAGNIAANLAKVPLAFAPEVVRLAALEGLRGGGGALAFAASAGLVGGIFTAFAAVWWKGGNVIRWLLAAAALDLVLPVVSTGFVGRYAFFAAAMVAVALGVAVERARGARRVALAAVAGLLLVTWTFDHVVDVVETREGGRVVAEIVDRAVAVRAGAPPWARIALIDAPDHWGRDDELPLFNWGLPLALEARGAAGPWLLLRTTPCWTSTDHRQVSEAELASIVRDGAEFALRFDPESRRLRLWRPPDG